MARLAAKIQKGFYPLPNRFAAMIGLKLRLQGSGATILDPCAGCGVAISTLARHAKIPDQGIFAVELDVERSRELSKNLPNSCVFGSTDYLSCLASGSVACVFVNPPFDDEIGGGGRVESSFISKAISEVQDDGVVIIVIPEKVLLRGDVSSLILNKLYQVEWCEFPASERKFGEVCIFGYKKKESFVDPAVTIADLKRDYRQLSLYRVADAVSGGVNYRKWEYTDQELDSILDGTEASKLLSEATLHRYDDVRPPMPLRSAHIAMLLASGLVNGLVEAGKDTHVVRGQAKKVKVIKEDVEGKQVRTTETERIALSVKIVDMDGNIRSLTDQLNNEVSEEESGNED